MFTMALVGVWLVFLAVCSVPVGITASFFQLTRLEVFTWRFFGATFASGLFLVSVAVFLKRVVE